MATLMPVQDAIFLLPERREQPMHVGGLQLFALPEGAGPGWAQDLYDRMLDSTDVRTLFRRRPVRSLRTLGTYGWEVDDDIDLEHHVRHSALPRPGRIRELLGLVSRLHGTLLDRQRPLWELHLIEGLEGDRFAIYTKIHHSLLDGVSAMRLLQDTLSADPEAPLQVPWGRRPRSARAGQGPAPAGERPQGEAPGGEGPGVPGPGGMAVAAVRAGRELAAIAPALGHLAASTLRSGDQLVVPRTLLNVPITGSRRFAAQSWPMERIRAVATASEVTVNDVVLAMCGAALRTYLQELGSLPAESLVAMTPVALRRDGGGEGGNAVGAILATLATDEVDPARRLERVHESMQRGKAAMSGLGPLGAGTLSAVLVAPLAITSTRWWAGLGVGRQPFNLVVSNVPGPDGPLHLAGARLTGLYPLSIPLDGQALNVTVTSYDGSMEWGLTGDRKALPHLQRLLAHLDRGLDDLARVAGV